MDINAFDNYLEVRYQTQMEYYKNASRTNQKKYKLFQWVLIILSVLTPVFAALKEIKVGVNNNLPPFDSNFVVLVLSSIVAILTTGLKTFNYQELWITARLTYEKLKPEIHYYNFNIGPYGAQDINKESLFVNRIESILALEHNQWPLTKTLVNKDQTEKTDHKN